MDIKNFKSGALGKGYKYQYFLPELINHSFYWTDTKINAQLEKASIKLGELNSFSRLVPDVDMFIRTHVLKEAVVSSRIEGTRTEMEEALLKKSDVKPEKRSDWQEVNNYVDAMNTAIQQLQKLPLSNRLLRNAHKKLLHNVRGEYKNPGEFRTSQNWIGGATITDAIFVPPTHTEVPGLMADLEKFLHNDDIAVPHLVKIAVAHYQFETIHPFLDGNGRVGRLLITLYLVSSGILDRPLLYLSDFFEKHKSLYYDNLTRVREKNDLSQWLLFFLIAVEETASKAALTLNQILVLKENIEKERIIKLGKKINNARNFLDYLYSSPVIQVKDVEKKLSLSTQASYNLVDDFVKLNILKEITDFSRNRIFIFDEYVKLFK